MAGGDQAQPLEQLLPGLGQRHLGHRPHGFEVTLEEAELAFTDASVEDYLDGEFAHHPLGLARRAALEPAGILEPVRGRMASIGGGQRGP